MKPSYVKGTFSIEKEFHQIRPRSRAYPGQPAFSTLVSTLTLREVHFRVLSTSAYKMLTLTWLASGCHAIFV